MRARGLRTLRTRLFAGIAATVAASLIVTVVAGAVLTRRSLEQDALRSLARGVELVAAQRGPSPSPNYDERNLGSFLSTEHVRLTILTPTQAELLLPAEAASALGGGRVVTGSVELRGTRYLYAARRNGAEALVLLRSAKSQAADWTPFLVGLGIAALVGAALAAVVALGLARAVARPVTRVAAASRRLAAGDDPAPLSVEGPKEVASLAASFNDLARELALASEAERTFLLSVSHELKTPLTMIRGHAEALADGILDGPQAGAVIEREARRLERLIHDLLDLARLRRRAFAVGREPIDLGEIAAETVARHLPQARAFGVDLSAVVAPPATALGDADRVLQAASNLVENALRCTPRDGAVRVVAGGGRLDIVDDGAGLAAEDLEHAFDRFYLYERYASERPVGTGLGLAIVRELAEAMGGGAEVRSVAGVGSTFSIVLPRSEAAASHKVTPTIARANDA
jgi:two-component system OmpR family sensor kinase